MMNYQKLLAFAPYAYALDNLFAYLLGDLLALLRAGGFLLHFKYLAYCSMHGGSAIAQPSGQQSGAHTVVGAIFDEIVGNAKKWISCVGRVL